MLLLLRNAELRLPVLLLALLCTGELCHSPEITEAYRRKERCESCGFKYDDCFQSEPDAVLCPGTFFCFKLYSTSLNRLQKGCSNVTTQLEWKTAIKLGSAAGKQSVCFDATEANFAMITECQGNQWNSNCSFEKEKVPQFNQGSQGAPDVSKMTSKMCICQTNKTAPCNEGDVPGFEDIRRAKDEVNQCYACNSEPDKICDDLKGKPEAVQKRKWCRTNYCSITKKREYSYRDIAAAEAQYWVRSHRGCADYYEDPGKTLECLKGSKDGCMNVKKLRKCSPIKANWPYDVDDYKENDEGEDMKECICKGDLCNDKPTEEIKLDAGAETSVIFNKKLMILMVPALFEAFCRAIDGRAM